MRCLTGERRRAGAVGVVRAAPSAAHYTVFFKSELLVLRTTHTDTSAVIRTQGETALLRKAPATSRQPPVGEVCRGTQVNYGEER